MKMRLASLISGGGTTMEAIGKACLSAEIPFDLVCVISSDPSAGGLEKAKNLGIAKEDVIVINPEDFREDGKIDREKFGEVIIEQLKKRKVDVVLQNGWLPLTPKNAIDQYQGMIFNQHPGPIPETGGKGMMIKAVLATILEFKKQTGKPSAIEMTAQRVGSQYDSGSVVKSVRVPIDEDDTVESLQQKCLPVEHRVQIELLKDIANGTVREITRQSFVLPGEEKVLEEAKQKAIEMYPEG